MLPKSQEMIDRGYSSFKLHTTLGINGRLPPGPPRPSRPVHFRVAADRRMETETKSLVFVSEDEGTASDPIDQKNSGATVEELEEEIRELEKTLKRERSERRRIQAAAQEEVEREVIKAEEIWMERARQAIQVGRMWRETVRMV